MALFVVFVILFLFYKRWFNKASFEDFDAVQRQMMASASSRLREACEKLAAEKRHVEEKAPRQEAKQLRRL